jgi:hypothetical protein
MKWGCEGLCAAEFAVDRDANKRAAGKLCFRLLYRAVLISLLSVHAAGALVPLQQLVARVKRALLTFRPGPSSGTGRDGAVHRQGEDEPPRNSILVALGIPQASRQKSIAVLWGTLCAHLALALLGMCLPRGTE